MLLQRFCLVPGAGYRPTCIQIWLVFSIRHWYQATRLVHVKFCWSFVFSSHQQSSQSLLKFHTSDGISRRWGWTGSNDSGSPAAADTLSSQAYNTPETKLSGLAPASVLMSGGIGATARYVNSQSWYSPSLVWLHGRDHIRWRPGLVIRTVVSRIAAESMRQHEAHSGQTGINDGFITILAMPESNDGQTYDSDTSCYQLVAQRTWAKPSVPASLRRPERLKQQTRKTASAGWGYGPC